MDFPLQCPSCGRENWIDLTNPIRKIVNKIVVLEGYQCQCGEFIKFHFSTPSLASTLEKVRRYKPESPVFKWIFLKAVKKAIGIREKFDG